MKAVRTKSGLIRITPHPLLKEFIEFYWIVERAEAGKGFAMLFPSTSPELIFKLGGSDIFWGREGRLEKAPCEELIGSFNMPMDITAEKHYHLLGIRFFPHAIHCLFRLNMQVLRNRINDANYILKDAVTFLKPQLIGAGSIPEQTAVLNTFFLDLAKRFYFRNDPYFSFFNWVSKSQTTCEVDQITRKLGCTPRYLQKLFHLYIGVSPQQYLQIRRLHKAVSLMNTNEYSLTCIALECGYADQSHFIRVFKKYTSQVPLQFLKNYYAVNI